MIPCIIPARGGSKGIPRKNLVEVGGKPLIAWSIEQAQATPSIDVVIVSSDSDEILEYASSLGAIAWRRSAESATDEAPTEAALLEIVRDYRYSGSECVVFLQATSPIRQPDDIELAVKKFRYTAADSLFSARSIEGYTWDASKRVLNPRDGARRPRQAESRRNLEENGSIYIFRPSILRDFGNRLGGKIVPYVMHPLDSFQIDEPEDIPLIESLMEVRCGHYHAATSE
jgi:CMP-N,N'-diacetyllegionaminic acid synthase